MQKWFWVLAVLVVSVTGAGLACKQYAIKGDVKPPAAAVKPASGTYDIRDFGAVGDGKTLNTKAFQAAIDACTKNGGGVVIVPPGTYLTANFEMKDNVTLRIQGSATIKGSGKLADYTRGRNIPAGNGNYVLISAAGAQNFAIEGPGTIDGDGANYFNGRGDGMGPTPPGMPRSTSTPNVDRPHMLVFSECKNFKVENIFLTRSAYHTIRILNCEYVTFDKIRIDCRVIQNNDGFHFGSCKYVTISNCNVRCFDDACALFGNNQYVTVTNSTFSTRWSVFRFGNSDHVTVSNCVIYETYGCPIKIMGNGNTNMIFSDIIMRDVTGPISIVAGGRGGSGGGGKKGGRGGRGGRGGAVGATSTATPLATNTVTTGTPITYRSSGVRNIQFNNIECTVVDQPRPYADFKTPPGFTPVADPIIPGVRPGEKHTCITLSGTSGTLENISFNNVHVTYPGGGTLKEGALRDVPAGGGEYFMIGERPAYGLYARGAKGLTLNNVRFDVASPDLRPAVILDGVRDAAIANLSVQGNPGAESVLRMTNSQDILMTATRLTTPAALWLSLEGSGNKNIKFDGGDFSKAGKFLNASNGAEENAVVVK